MAERNGEGDECGDGGQPSGCLWMVVSPFVAVALALLFSNLGDRPGSELDLESTQDWGWAFVALGGGTALVSLMGMAVTNHVRKAPACWVAAVFWALGSGVAGALVVYVILMLVVRMIS